MDNLRQKRSWFEGKKCFVCSKQGSIFRLIKNKHYVLCDSQKCDFNIRIREGIGEVSTQRG